MNTPAPAFESPYLCAKCGISGVSAVKKSVSTATTTLTNTSRRRMQRRYQRRCALRSRPMSSATMHTNHGAIELELFDGDAPKTVENFRKLAGDGFYAGVIFHRATEDVMIQGVDPPGTGPAGPASPLEDEVN